MTDVPLWLVGGLKSDNDMMYHIFCKPKSMKQL